MVGDFMVCVDRIITSACFDPSSAGAEGGGDGGGGGGCVAPPAPAPAAEAGSDKNKGKNRCEKKRNNGKNKNRNKGGEVVVVECRICQEEGDDSDMESPCACNGTLKFAHRKCIQRWCNKKGNITCEICNQVYAPNYSIPPTRACSDSLTIDIRQGWGPQMDHRDFLAIAIAEQELLHAEYDDFASVATSTSVSCCRSVALILMLLLLVRHILVIMRDINALQDVSALFNFVGLFLPCYVIARSCYIIQSRRRRQA